MRVAALALVTTALALAGLATRAPGVPASSAQGFNPSVSVTISDDAPGSHPDITTTIEALTGPTLSQARLLTAGGGGIASDAEISDGTVVGWISGFTTIPAADGSCTQRYTFEVPVLKQPADAAALPAYLRDLAPGPHHIRFAADVAGTAVNIMVDDVVIDGQPRLQTTTYIGDPAQPAPACAPYRSRATLYGMAGSVALTTAPPTAGPRVSDFTLTAQDGEVAERTATATVAALRPRLDGGSVRWDAVPGAASYRTTGLVTYATNCALTRRLVIRQEGRDLNTQVGPGTTGVPLPPAPGSDYELAQASVQVSAFDADGVLLARDPISYTRDFAACWYAPGTEPVLTAEPAAGSCDGAVTFHGSRFPTGVNVEITMPYFGSDAPGAHVVTAPVADDGSFAVTAPLPDQACTIASLSPQGIVAFFAYNADEPKTMTIFARASYAATIPPGRALPAVIAPVTGTGPPRGPAAMTPWWLLAAGAACLGAGFAIRRHDER